MSARQRYAHLTSILEMPLLNASYWSKIPAARVTGFMLDLEDTAHPNAKGAARERLLEALEDPGYFGGREIIVRVNNLATPWGREDLEALARSACPLTVCYPKVASAEELEEVVRLTRAHAPDRGVAPMIETASAVLELDAVARTPGVVGLHFGYTDYAVDAGVRTYAEEGDDLHRALWGVRHQVAMVAAARGLFATGGSMIPMYRELDKVERFVRGWAEAGYTGMLALAPSHLDVITRVFVPEGEERARHETLVRAFDGARAEGRSSLVVDGAIITEAAYRQSLTALARIPGYLR
jgi:citrate lyase beta subunit